MVIEWGTLGFNWGRPVFACYVRQSRFTREMLDSNPEFTINLSTQECDKRIISICGTKSGRDIDKVATLGFTLIDGNKVSVPAIKEMPLTLECKVIYRQEQEYSRLPITLQERFYPDTQARNHDNAEDEHIVYFGEIVDAYLLKE